MTYDSQKYVDKHCRDTRGWLYYIDDDQNVYQWCGCRGLKTTYLGGGATTSLPSHFHHRVISSSVKTQITRCTVMPDGPESNFKLWDTELSAEDAKRLYGMGRCDEGHHEVNFSKTRVGIGLGDGEAPRRRSMSWAFRWSRGVASRVLVRLGGHDDSARPRVIWKHNIFDHGERNQQNGCASVEFVQRPVGSPLHVG